MITKKVLQQIYWGSSLIMLAAKITSDFIRHGNHQGHSQRCDCFTQCLPCMIEPVKEARIRRQHSSQGRTLDEFLQSTAHFEED